MGTETLAKEHGQKREVPQPRPKKIAHSGPAKGATGHGSNAKLAMALFTFQSWSLSTRHSGLQNLGS